MSKSLAFTIIILGLLCTASANAKAKIHSRKTKTEVVVADSINIADSIPQMIAEDVPVQAFEKVDTAATWNMATAYMGSIQLPHLEMKEGWHPYKDKTTQFRGTQFIAPGVLIAVGITGYYSNWFKSNLNEPVRDWMGDIRGNHYFHADDYLQYLPLAAYLTIGFIPNAHAKHPFRERLLVGTTTFIAMTAIAQVSKQIFKEPRPDTGARSSFPSGHTATAFAGAELIRMEYGTGCAIGAYVYATGIAFLRMYNNRHWLNDVIAGAGVGILSAHIGYWMLPLYKKWFKWRNPTDAVMVGVPYYEPENKSVGVSLAVSF